MKRIILTLIVFAGLANAFEGLAWLSQDTLKYPTKGFIRFYTRRITQIDTLPSGKTFTMVPTHQLITAGKYAIIDVSNIQRAREYGIRTLYVKWRINSGAVEIIHTDMRFKVFNFATDNITIVIGTTQDLGTENQWGTIRNIIRTMIYDRTGVLYD